MTSNSSAKRQSVLHQAVCLCVNHILGFKACHGPCSLEVGAIGTQETIC